MRTPISRSMKWLSIVSLAALSLVGCGGGSSGSGTSGAQSSGSIGASLAGATAASTHYVVATFAEPAGPGASDPANYVITGPGGVRLPVTNAEPSADRRSVTLTTATQQVVQYELAEAPNQQASASQGFFIRTASAATATDSVTFTGSAQPEPVLMTAISLSNTSVLLTFSENMSLDTQTIEYYRIVATDDSAPVRDVGGLKITAATLGADPTTVVLTTSPQESVEYGIKVTNVTDDPEGKRIDPTRNTGAFFGIAPVDTVRPRVSSAASTSLTTMIVTFSEPVGASAGDPANYTITYCRTDIDPCPAADVAHLTVLAAELSKYNTQVLLTTLPQTVGTSYSVEVNSITDLAGNVIESAVDSDGDGLVDNVANVISAEQSDLADITTPPRVVGAVSTGNTGVTVVFSKPMGEGAEDAKSYAIAQENVNTEAGVLLVTNAYFPNPNDQTVVQLTTLAQNEVTYRVTVVGVKDVFGNQLAAKEYSTGVNLFSDPASATFAGTPGEVVTVTLSDLNNDGIIDGWQDNDSDGLLSAGDRVVDSSGNSVVIVDLNGNGVLDATDGWNDTNGNLIPDTGDEITAFSVDTDGDGLLDSEEQRGWTVTVRLADQTTITREVTSSPFSRDTDGDGVGDAEERHYLTDPRDADTDDDQLTDYRELNAVYSDPSDQDSDDDGLDDGLEHDFFHTSALFADTDGDSLSDSYEIFTANRNPRIADLPQPQIKIGSMDLALDVRFETEQQQGQQAVDTKQAEVTLQQDQSTTVSTTDQQTNSWFWKAGASFGTEVEISAKSAFGGAKVSAEFNTEGGTSGETTFTASKESAQSSSKTFANTLTTEKTVSREETLSRHVDAAQIGVLVNVENLSNIAFTMTDLEITALVKDPRDPRILTPIGTLFPSNPDLAINLGALDTTSRGPFRFVDAAAFPSRVEDLMSNPRGVVFKVANYNITDESGRNFAFGEQDANDRTSPLVIDFGVQVEKDGRRVRGAVERYRVATNSDFDVNGHPKGISVASALEDIIGLAYYREEDTPTETLSPEQIANSYSTFDNANGVPVIWRIRDVRPTASLAAIKAGGDSSQTWVALLPTGIDYNVDVRSFNLQPERGLTLAFVQDLDKDGVPARVELYYGSLDDPLDAISPATATDSDNDYVRDLSPPLDDPNKALSDNFEIYAGVDVSINRALGNDVQETLFTVYPSPARADTDGDGLTDWEETTGCLDRNPVDRVCDPDTGFGKAVLVDADGKVSYTRFNKTTDPTYPDTDGDRVLDADEVQGYFVDTLLGGTVFVTSDPADVDTDNDGVSDGDEVLYGGNPTVPDVDSFTDSDGDGLLNIEEKNGWTVTYQQVSTTRLAAGITVTCTPVDFANCKDENGTPQPPTSDPNPGNVDTDGDGLTDLQERDLGTHPRLKDTDGDGVSDFDEVNGVTWQNDGAPATVKIDPRDADTDDDLRSDGDEVTTPIVIQVAGQAPYNTFSHPAEADRDNDGLVDGEEAGASVVDWSFVTDPNKFDTDGDAPDTGDKAEAAICAQTTVGGVSSNRCRDPLTPDQRVKVSIVLAVTLDGDPTNAGDFTYNSAVSIGTDTQISGGTGGVSSSIENNIGDGGSKTILTWGGGIRAGLSRIRWQ